MREEKCKGCVHEEKCKMCDEQSLFYGSVLHTPIFHIFHKWGKWEEYGYELYGGGWISRQRRICSVCGKIETAPL